MERDEPGRDSDWTALGRMDNRASGTQNAYASTLGQCEPCVDSSLDSSFKGFTWKRAKCVTIHENRTVDTCPSAHNIHKHAPAHNNLSCCTVRAATGTAVHNVHTVTVY